MSTRLSGSSRPAAISSSIALASREDCSTTALPSAAAFGNALRRTIDVASTADCTREPR